MESSRASLRLGVAALVVSAAACSRKPAARKPIAELASVSHAEALADDPSSVYWTRFVSAAGVVRVESLSKIGAVRRVVAEVPATRDWMFDRIAVDDDRVYWFARVAADVTLWGVPKGGGAPIVLAAGQHGVTGNLLVQDGRLYWAADSEVRAVPVAGGTVVTVARTPGGVGPDGIVVDATSLFWVNGAGVFRAPLGGGLPVLVTGVAGRLPRLASSKMDLYVTSEPGPLGSGTESVLEAVPKAGGPLTPVLRADRIRWVSYDGHAIHCTHFQPREKIASLLGNNHDTLVELPPSGGPEIALAELDSTPFRALVVDTDTVYAITGWGPDNKLISIPR